MTREDLKKLAIQIANSPWVENGITYNCSDDLIEGRCFGFIEGYDYRQEAIDELICGLKSCKMLFDVCSLDPTLIDNLIEKYKS
ncbi:MAG: hypothetical protein FWC41_13225 [Firmicutes bacterium]|nr:hypothetical protein [Bacillota bacterium]